MVKNILITGGAGYIGSHTIEILIKNKKKIGRNLVPQKPLSPLGKKLFNIV